LERRAFASVSSVFRGITAGRCSLRGDVLTLELLGRDEEGLANSPALSLLVFTDDMGDVLYDCG